MEVIIIHSDLKGSDYSHHPFEKRYCPLHTAMARMFGVDKVAVGYSQALVIDGEKRDKYNIPEHWNRKTVTKYIDEANNGDTKEITLTLTPCE